MRAARPLLLAEPTRFAALSRWQARAVLALVAALLLATLTALAVPGSAEPPQDGGAVANAESAAAMSDGVIESVRHGGNYYAVTAEALRSAGTPPHPFATFRLPTLAVAMALLPSSLRPVPLSLLTLLVLIVWAHRLRGAFSRRAPLIVVLLALVAGALTGLQAGLVGLHEVWAGLLVALSLALRRRGRWVEAVATGLCAMLVRELAVTFAMLMLVMALWEGERREAAGWAAALAVFAVVLATHAHAVAAVVHPGDHASPEGAGMLGFGFFVHSMVQDTGLRLLPVVIAAPLAGLSIAGWAAWRDPLGARVLALLATYGVLMAVAARGDTPYWALLVAPVSLAGLAFVPDAARDLLRAAFDARRITVTRVTR